MICGTTGKETSNSDTIAMMTIEIVCFYLDLLFMFRLIHDHPLYENSHMHKYTISCCFSFGSRQTWRLPFPPLFLYARVDSFAINPSDSMTLRICARSTSVASTSGGRRGPASNPARASAAFIGMGLVVTKITLNSGNRRLCRAPHGQCRRPETQRSSPPSPGRRRATPR